MKVYSKSFRISTGRKLEAIDITRQVESIVSESKIGDGICLIHAPHATAAIVVNEDENGLIHDILAAVDELFPEDGRYRHNRIDDNARSHIASAFLGPSRLFPVEGGRIIRGTWQNILFLELDGPRARREVHVQVLGE